jgi:hypothetical protein
MTFLRNEQLTLAVAIDFRAMRGQKWRKSAGFAKMEIA